MPLRNSECAERTLLLRFIARDPAATESVRRLAPTATSVPLLVTSALLTDDDSHLRRAAQLAVSTRDRQLVALAQTRRRGDVEQFDVLVREHLADHPDDIVAAWLAAEPHHPNV